MTHRHDENPGGPNRVPAVAREPADARLVGDSGLLENGRDRRVLREPGSSFPGR